MRYIIAAASKSCYKTIARTNSFQAACFVQFALEQTYLLKVIIIDSRGL